MKIIELATKSEWVRNKEGMAQWKQLEIESPHAPLTNGRSSAAGEGYGLSMPYLDTLPRTSPLAVFTLQIRFTGGDVLPTMV